jgi:hypothetical protein
LVIEITTQSESVDNSGEELEVIDLLLSLQDFLRFMARLLSKGTIGLSAG